VAALACAAAAAGAGTRSSAAPTLLVHNSFALDTTDPQRAFNPTSTIVDRAVYDTLFTYRNGDLAHPVPLLVQSWTSTSSRLFTFRLKRNIRFADGSPLTAADVVFSLRRLVNLKGNPSFLLAGATVAARGDYMVVVDAGRPAPQLLSILANASTGIVNSKLVRAHGGTDAVDAAGSDRAERWFDSPDSAGAGSGPYVLESYDRTSQVVLRANTSYWGQAKPPFARVVIRNAPASVQLLDVQRGSHEIALDLSSEQAETLKGDPRLHVTRQPSPWTFYAFANDDPRISPITSNERFRQAVRSALDYRALVSVAGRGAIQAAGMIASTIPGALGQDDAPRHDAAKAGAELAASGVGTQKVTLEYPSDLTVNGVPFATLAQKVQASLQDAGLDVALAGSPVTSFQPRFRAGKIAFGIWVWAPDYADPADYLVFTPGKLIALHAGWQAGSDPAIEKLAARALVTTAPTARRSLYRRIQLALNARGPFIPLIQPAQVFAATSDLAGAAFSGAYDVDVTQVSPA
jgi:peptide/nickel transport system substrate-binding protein